MSCNLVGSSEDSALPSGPALAGTHVSSLHRLKDTDNIDGAFFVFGDLSIKQEGVFRLQFNLYEMGERECHHIRSIQSHPFTVEDHKNFRGLLESTALTRSFSDQGVRLRLRKEPRALLRKRGPAYNDYEPRRYRRQQSSGELQPSDSKDPPKSMQAEPVDTMQHQIGSPPRQHKPMGRGYSQSSGYSEDTPIKRPRTGSEQGSTFSQHQLLDSPRSFDNFGPPFAQQQQQQPYYQSPQSSTMSPREQYSVQRPSMQTSNYSYGHSSQQSPQDIPYHSSFPPQPQALPHHNPVASSLPQRTHNTQGYAGLGIHQRTYMSPTIQASGMTGMQQPPTYGRINNAPAFGSLIATTFGEYPIHHENMEDNLLGIGGHSLNTTSAPMYTTSAPGM